MSTETTKGAGDRIGCLWFCGMRGADIVADPRRLPSGVRCGVNWLTVDERCGDHDRRWCSPLCRDELRGPVGSTIPIADARGEGTCGPGPMTALSGSGGTPARDERSVRAGGLSASPANVSPPPAPAPGQRWRFAMTDSVVDLLKVDAEPGEFATFSCRHVPSGKPELIYRGTIKISGTYLGPTPTETPSPARTPATAPPPTLLAGAVAGVGGPPAGHVPCRLSCGRWTPPIAESSNGDVCYHCLGNKRTTWLLDLDWTPPSGWKSALTPPPGVKETAQKLQRSRPAGITCHRCLCTSDGGTHHLEACPRGDFLPRDAGLTSAEWSARVSALVLNAGLVRRAKSRVALPVDRRLPPVAPFVSEVDDYDLFGRNVR